MEAAGMSEALVLTRTTWHRTEQSVLVKHLSGTRGALSSNIRASTLLTEGLHGFPESLQADAS
jgi:hypothetical protein